MLWRAYLFFTILSICIADVTRQGADPDFFIGKAEDQHFETWTRRKYLQEKHETEELHGTEASSKSEATSDGTVDVIEGGSSLSNGGKAADEGGESAEPRKGELHEESENVVEEGKEEGTEGEEEEEEAEFSDIDLTMAWGLLGFVTFNMVLFYLVNYPDEDMRLYVWSVVSVTISIFMAVLLFQTATALLAKIFPWDKFHVEQIVIAFVQLVVYFSAMQISVAKLCGVLDDDPFPSTLSTEEVAKEMHAKERKMKSVSGLLAHMAGFALINFGGSLQHMSWELLYRPYTFIFLPGIFIGHLIATRFVRKFRRSVMRKRVKYHHQVHADQYESMAGDSRVDEEEKEEKQGMDWCTETWDEETYECENEIASIGMSFLIVQAVRFNISGVMPNTLGIEEADYIHSVNEILILSGCGLFFAVSCVGLVVQLHYFEMQPIEPGTCKSFLKRMMKVLQVTFAMAFAWCLQNSIKWGISTFNSMHGFEPNPNGIISRVLMAVVISFLSFAIIVCLDWIYDQDCTGDTADEAISSLIRALSLLVGFCWEQSFDCCVEVLGERFNSPLVLESTLTLAICILVYPAWRWYVLDKVLVLTKERRIRLNREKKKHHHHD